MSNNKKEIIKNLEKVLEELKKKEEKPKTIEEHLKEISDKLSKLLEKNDIDSNIEKFKEIMRTPKREEIIPFTYPMYPREITDFPRTNPLKPYEVWCSVDSKDEKNHPNGIVPTWKYKY